MRIVILLIFAYALVFANALVHFEKGWSLAGVSTSLENMDKFDNENVEIVWAFDVNNQLWEGYSPDETLATKISDNNLSTLASLRPYQAFWILSKEAWSFEAEDGDLASEENSFISLKKGWNLISIPQQVVVPSDFFGDALVWKYSDSEKWSVSDASLDFPSIEDIKSSEGLWVKSEEDRELDIAKSLSRLQTFSTEADMLEYIRKMLRASAYSYGYLEIDDISTLDVVPVAMEETGGDTKVDATTTNLQESGVDESDVLKHDGVNVYSVDNLNSQIFITSFERIAAKNHEAINVLSTKDKEVVAMYLVDKRLILISRSYDYVKQEYGEYAIDPYSYNLSILVESYDVSDVNDIVEISSYKIDGSYAESRLVDGRLFLISSFYPSVDYEYPKAYVDTICDSLDRDEIYAECYATSFDGEDVVEQECSYGKDSEAWSDNDCYAYSYDEKGAYAYDYDNPVVLSERLIPYITLNDKTSNLLSPSKFYAPIKLNQSSNVTTISSFKIEDGTYNQSVSFVGNAHTHYASESSLYLLSREYPIYFDYSNYKEREMVYKFSIGEKLDYVSRGFVDGRALNQFSMSEKDDYLRIATTSGFSWMSEETDNAVYTLKSSGDDLQVQGTLSGLGKSGETIQAVRFMGDRGFVVTFKQTDPLYTLDLSDPKNPQKVGELSIPGFSRYLHVVDENRVLSIGRDADEISGETLGLQLQLFDVSDFANPILADRVQVGSGSTYSSAEYNHKAFAYRPSDLTFGLPYSNYDNQSSSENFGIYQIDGMKINSIDVLSKTYDSYYWGDEKRGLIFDLNSSTYGALIEGSDILSDKIREGE